MRYEVWSRVRRQAHRRGASLTAISGVLCMSAAAGCAERGWGHGNASTQTGEVRLALEADGGGPAPGEPDGGMPPAFDGGIDPPGVPSSPVPRTHLRFDDCDAASTQLVDSSPLGAHATRSTSVACGEGLLGQSVVFDDRRDSVDVPANPAFALDSSVTVAAWINPRSLVQGSIVNKQLRGATAFELSIEQGRVIFNVTLQNARSTRKVSSSAPLEADRWTHVAGVYDGVFLRLFLDGGQVGQVADAGILADVGGPLRVGNDARNRFVQGAIDEVWFSDEALSADQVGELACLRGSLSLAISADRSGPVPPDTSVAYEVAVTNGDRGACRPRDLFWIFDAVPEGFSTSLPESFLSAAAGETVHFHPTVTGTADAEPGTHFIPFSVFDLNAFEFMSGQLEYQLAEPSGCFVRTSRELLIRDLSVVEDPLRTSFDGPADDPRTGVWTFGGLMRQMAPSPEQAPAMVERMFRSWLGDQLLNGFVAKARTTMAPLVLDHWPRTPLGELDLERAPLRLLAIVNRIDSRNLAQGHAGEGRFVFGVLDRNGFPLEFTFILEYRLPAASTADVLDWAHAWHALGALPFPSEEYNAALEALTTRFAGRGAEPARVNGSALAQLRTNEIALEAPWELREFELSTDTGMLEPATVKLTPDTGFLFESPLVARFVNQNEAAILREQHEVPETFEGERFLGASSLNDLFAWRSSGISNNEARHKFSLNTCNGCHSAEETGTAFLHVFPRFPGQQSALSGFMTGTVVSDPVTGEPRSLNDLGRRNQDMKALVCPESEVATITSSTRGPGDEASSAREAFVSKGIARVH